MRVNAFVKALRKIFIPGDEATDLIEFHGDEKNRREGIRYQRHASQSSTDSPVMQVVITGVVYDACVEVPRQVIVDKLKSFDIEVSDHVNENTGLLIVSESGLGIRGKGVNRKLLRARELKIPVKYLNTPDDIYAHLLM